MTTNEGVLTENNMNIEFYDSSIKTKENISIIKKSLKLRKSVYGDELHFENADDF